MKNVGTEGRPRGSMLEELHRLAAEDPDALVAWFRVYVTYFRNLVAATAEQLYRSLGLRAGMMTLGQVVEEAISRSFHVQKEAAKSRGMKLETLDDLFTLNKYCHSEAASRLAMLGIEVFKIWREGDRYYMETEECNLFKNIEEAPVLRVFPVALVSGLIRGLGARSKWLSSRRELEYLCRSAREGHTPRPDYVVYLDDVEPPACRIVVEPFRC